MCSRRKHDGQLSPYNIVYIDVVRGMPASRARSTLSRDMVCCLYVNVSSRASETLRTPENTEGRPIHGQTIKINVFYCQPHQGHID